ncbi:globin domain-containing protein [Nakamurella sp.]|uniref:globin domain-containing protein n=1 Tax=Nakamurella sp. TaxID=1869182 RepID=UPI0037851E1C
MTILVQPVSAEQVNPAALKANFAAVATHGDDVAMYFYNYLFLTHPAVRTMFPLAMTEQRDRLLTALVRVVTHVDRMAELEPYLAELGRDHRKFGALADHYPAVGEALLATMAHFTGPGWTDALAANWSAAYGVVANAMAGAADADAGPAWYDGEIVRVDRRTFDLAVLRVRTGTVVPYRAGQSVPLQATGLRPRIWRPYTPATMPGGDEFDLHVRAIDGGTLSTALVRAARPGDPVRLGAPYGRMFLDPDAYRPLLMIAGGTGLAPMKAMLEQLAAEGGRPTHLFHGVRTGRELYENEWLGRMAAEHHQWLTVVTATSDDEYWGGPRGRIGELAATQAEWAGHDVYVCGSPEMVEGTVKALVFRGVSEDRIVFEEFGKA